MKVADVAGLIVLGLLVVGVFAGLLFLAVRRYSGINRSELRDARRKLNEAADLIEQIDAVADLYREVDSVISGEVRNIIRKYRQESRNT